MAPETVLNDVVKMRLVDKSDMLSFCTNAPLHYEKAVELAKAVRVDYPLPKAIIVSGMGGSAIGGELLKDWTRERINVPVEVCRDYSLPEYANKETLVFVVSYSGETEETLSAFLEAIKRKCMTICISSGGLLQKFAQKLSIPHLSVPQGMAPRATLPYLFMPLPAILERIGLTEKVTRETAETIQILKQVSDGNSPERPVEDNFSKKLASNVCGTVPVIYGFGFYRAVAQRLKTQFNENSKNPAKWEVFPELNHNEIVGWEEAWELAKCFSVILLRDKREPPHMRERIEATKELLRRDLQRIFEIHGRGKGTLAKMSSVILTGDFTSVYLAVIRGIDPTPVKTISLLKEKLKQTGVKKKIVQQLQQISTQ